MGEFFILLMLIADCTETSSVVLSSLLASAVWATEIFPL
jgi:hypothetical protein